MKKNNNIDCNVSSCKHNNSDDDSCTLDSIKVTSTDDKKNDECVSASDTACDSFETDTDTSSDTDDDNTNIEAK